MQNDPKSDPRPKMTPGGGPVEGLQSPDVLAKSSGPTVTMNFPHAVRLNHGGKITDFPAGIHEVPEALAGHWFLKDHGVTRLKLKVAEKEPELELDEEEEIEQSTGTELLTNTSADETSSRQRRKKK